jgi:hypothetical protein
MRSSITIRKLATGAFGLAVAISAASCASGDITSEVNGAPASGTVSAASFSVRADDAARRLINELGAQQTFARLGWQQNPDYEPAEPCFDFWLGAGAPGLSDQDVSNCEAHASDLSGLYASYGTEVDPIVFKARYFWDERDRFDLVFPGLVEAWKAAGGNEDDPSFLDHPVCAEPLQTGWAGSDCFYDGSEHPLCRLFKLDPSAATQR